jgi:hypothetical protein
VARHNRVVFFPRLQRPRHVSNSFSWWNIPDSLLPYASPYSQSSKTFGEISLVAAAKLLLRKRERNESLTVTV